MWPPRVQGFAKDNRRQKGMLAMSQCYMVDCTAPTSVWVTSNDGGAPLAACQEHEKDLRHTIDCALGWCRDPDCDGSFVDPDFERTDDLP